MKNRGYIYVLIVALELMVGTLVSAQETQDSTFKSKGTPIITVFANYNRGFHGSDSPKNDLQLTRAYMGYRYTLTEHFTSEIIFDVGSDPTETMAQIMVLRNALVRYHNENVTVSVGMIPTMQVIVHDEFWGYRYLLKSFQNRYGFGPSVDVGVSALYEFEKFMYIDASIVQGNGLYVVPADSTMKFTIGTTFFPARNFRFRVYYDYKNDNREQTFSAFGGFKRKRTSVGMEFAYQFNHDGIAGHGMWGGSLFSTYKWNEKNNVMFRCDKLISRDSWNSDNDGTLLLLGMEHVFSKNIKMSPNLRLWNPSHENYWNSSIYVNVQFNF